MTALTAAERAKRYREGSRKRAIAPWSHSYEELMEFARQNRRNATKAEKTLWQYLRRRALGVKVRRQIPIRGYIADFFIPAWGIVIEVDGASHKNRQAYDRRKDLVIASAGFKVLRFSNAQVFDDPNLIISRVRART